MQPISLVSENFKQQSINWFKIICSRSLNLVLFGFEKAHLGVGLLGGILYSTTKLSVKNVFDAFPMAIHG